MSALSRRSFLSLAGGALAFGAVTASGVKARAAESGVRARALPASGPDPGPTVADALAALGRTDLRQPGSLPYPALPAGTDTLPPISNIVVLMMENHSYDNLFGFLGRGRGRRPPGDGFVVGAGGQPTASNPYPDGRVQHAFHMPTTCQLSGGPSQEWTACHTAYDNGSNDGFVAASGPVAMGYWTGDDLPFTYDLAATFPVGDRWFCSVLGQTDPNRRYLIAATSAGMTDDIGVGVGDLIPDLSLPLPGSGTIFDVLDAHQVPWANYSSSFPTGATPELYPLDDTVSELAHMKPFDQFFADAAAGTLAPFTLLDPDYDTQSQENPQNIVVGEALLAQVVQAIGTSPRWPGTLLAVMYDEHGGYYDHVPPPPALAPDLIPPLVQPGEQAYEGFRRYGFRVPSVVVSPYAKRNHVSHVLYDHTSVLAMVERKWNLPALTYRDANANDLTDFLDLGALRAGRPTFPALPPLAAPGNTPAALACSSSGPGTIPPPGSISG